MKLENKTAISLIAFVLILTSVCIITLPKVKAEDRYYTSYVYVADGTGARGVGASEQVILVAWTADMPPDTGEKVGVVPAPTGRAGWHDMQIQIWDPDNETDILDLPYSDPVGATWTLYTPTKVGTYRIQAIFPYTDKELKWTGSIGMDFYEAGDHYVFSAAKSPIDTFEVYEEAAEPWD